MSARSSKLPLKLFLIDEDPIFRIGLRSVCQHFPDLQVVAEAEEAASALEAIAQLITKAKEQPVDLIILELTSGRSFGQTPSIAQLTICQQIAKEYPQIPILLLTSVTEPELLSAARQIGVKGYCPKGTPTPELIRAIRLVAGGQFYWSQMPSVGKFDTLTKSSSLKRNSNSPLTFLKRNLGLSSLRQIDAKIKELSTQLHSSQLSILERAVIEGQRRELYAARWLLNNLLGVTDYHNKKNYLPASATSHISHSKNQPSSEKIEFDDEESGKLIIPEEITAASPRAVQSELFDLTLSKLTSPLSNLSYVALEIDILRVSKKRELFSIVLRQLEELLDELRFSEIQLPQLIEKRFSILQDLWQNVTEEFFGKYYTIQAGNPLREPFTKQEIEVVEVLLQDAKIVRREILEKIPLVVELFAHLLFKSNLIIDNNSYPIGSPEARRRAEFLLQNLMIQVGNAVIQPLLNHLADFEEIKQVFYDRRWLSTRSIEKFRNNLSWKYRLEKYFGEPTAIFESRYWLFVLDERGIIKIPIYAPRTHELAQLRGIPLAVTYILESRDAIAPRLRSALSFIGSGLVYILTQVIGQGIGLIGRGIIQGIGNSWQDTKVKRQK
ncbi:MAG: DUF3685 domain-containing protein [Oscillatoriaceae bacterium SKW80]|nr:DUF3685 domain-containing protein [Oscillatoriaceae bacterium SKYG93]MCX8121539.1 DUF3685 domain-containing protein [Oscillatoriaceae bacterium SKW80]MDW8452875.1 DUF3685 domain-containing protein [Oscillatoriaceae cyanobacterium SKYGB_i_bin93]HIK27884.1 DUF3685 domain-containing protein [Oscillatoriaceae cyanobacterium M7585_C2015_266]